jgi:hypothetical protein
MRVTPQSFRRCAIYRKQWEFCHEIGLHAHRVRGSLTRRGIIISPFPISTEDSESPPNTRQRVPDSFRL